MSSRHLAGRSEFRAAAAVLLVALIVGAGAALVVFASVPTGTVRAIGSGVHLADGNISTPLATTPRGNVSISTSLPSASLPSKAIVEVTYTFHVTKFPSDHSTVTFYIPTEQVTFPVSGGGKVTVVVRPLSFSVSGTSTQGGASTLTKSTLANSEKFTSGTAAVMSSQLIAIMNTVPWGSAPIDFGWQWKVLAPGGGSTLASGASPSPSIEPQEYLTIVSDGPSQIKPGQTFKVCVGGSTIQDRTLSLHMEVPNPYYAFAWNTTHIPAGASSPYCWGVKMPLSFHKLPTALLVHVWAYATQPGILYVLHTYGVKGASGLVSIVPAHPVRGPSVSTLSAVSFAVSAMLATIPLRRP